MVKRNENKGRRTCGKSIAKVRTCGKSITKVRTCGKSIAKVRTCVRRMSVCGKKEFEVRRK